MDGGGGGGGVMQIELYVFGVYPKLNIAINSCPYKMIKYDYTQRF